MACRPPRRPPGCHEQVERVRVQAQAQPLQGQGQGRRQGQGQGQQQEAFLNFPLVLLLRQCDSAWATMAPLAKYWQRIQALLLPRVREEVSKA